MNLFYRRDLDGFFGLFVDNLVQLLLIVALCGGLCGMTGDNARFITHVILPGASISILFGNIFYGWQAHRLAKREGRTEVTALPYGINTPSLLVYVFFVMAPAYRETGSALDAWQMGLLACFGSGIIELFGSCVAERVRRATPRAALLSTLAGIAIGFIAMAFALQVWSKPIVAMAPLAIVLITYFSNVRFPLGLPGGFVAIVIGTAIAWTMPASWTAVTMSAEAVGEGFAARGFYLPQWSGAALWSVLAGDPAKWVPYLSVIVPMGLFNVIGSLQNIESAEAAGDKYPTAPSLAINGAGTMLAALFGSCFPTTIYIGHPGWKGLGARAGYSTLNGLVITLLCISGTISLVNAVVPIEVGYPIVLWIGIVITAQAFQATRKEHAPAVAIGLFPAIAGWGATVVFGAFLAAGGKDLFTLLVGDRGAEMSGFALHGLIVLERGYIFTCMIMAAVSAALIDRRFFTAAAWCVVGSIATFVGLCHTYVLRGNFVDSLLRWVNTTGDDTAIAFRANDITFGYFCMAMIFVLFGLYTKRCPRALDGVDHNV